MVVHLCPSPVEIERIWRTDLYYKAFALGVVRTKLVNVMIILLNLLTLRCPAFIRARTTMRLANL